MCVCVCVCVCVFLNNLRRFVLLCCGVQNTPIRSGTRLFLCWERIAIHDYF